MEDELYYEMVKSYVFIWDVNGEDKKTGGDSRFSMKL
jgi:hypothetical protein